MRVFYALTFSNSTKEMITPYRDNIANMSIKGRFTREENYHLTLEFIGNVNGQTLQELLDILHHLGDAPQSLRVEHYGSFKRREREIVWLGLQKNQKLNALHKQLTGLLADNDIPFEKRKYTPHITIGRQVLINAEIEELMLNPFDIKIHSIALMESKNIDGILRYEPIEEIVV